MLYAVPASRRGGAFLFSALLHYSPLCSLFSALLTLFAICSADRYRKPLAFFMLCLLCSPLDVALLIVLRNAIESHWLSSCSISLCSLSCGTLSKSTGLLHTGLLHASLSGLATGKSLHILNHILECAVCTLDRNPSANPTLQVRGYSTDRGRWGRAVGTLDRLSKVETHYSCYS